MSLRLNVNFSDAQLASLNRMSAEMDCSKTNVLRAALSLLEVVVRETQDPECRVCITKDGSIVKEISGLR